MGITLTQTATLSAADTGSLLWVVLSVTPKDDAPAGVASGTGTAQLAITALGVMAAIAAATGTAPQPTVEALVVTSAPAGAGSATGTAPQPAGQVRSGAAVAAGTGSAPTATPNVGAMAIAVSGP